MALQGRTWNSNIRLTLAGAPVTGVAFGDISVSYLRAGDTTLQTKVLTVDDWIEVGNGLYILKWSESDMALIGPFYFEISGGSFDPQRLEFDVHPAPIEALANPEVCLITGNITDLGGDAATQDPISFRLAKRPSAVNDVFVNTNHIRVVPNAYGAFTVALLRGVLVTVTIESVGIRHQFEVPDQSQAQLIDLLPPINNIP